MNVEELSQEDREWQELTKGTSFESKTPQAPEAKAEPVAAEPVAEAVEPVKAEPVADGTVTEPAKTETKAEETQAEPFPGFNNLPKEAQDAYTKAVTDAATIARERDDFANRWRAQHGQLAPAQRKLSELEKEIARLKTAEPKAGEKFGEWAKTMPADAEAIQDLVRPLQASVEEAKQLLARQDQELLELRRERETSKVAKVHPDYEEIVFPLDERGNRRYGENGEPLWNQEFYNWWAQQPQAVQSLAGSNDSGDWIQLLGYFKGARAISAPPPAAPKTDPNDAAVVARRQKALKDTEPPIRASQSVKNAPLSDEDAQWLAITEGNPLFR